MTRDEEQPIDNRDRKLEGRAKRRRFGGGSRAYLHAMTNSMAKRAKEKGEAGGSDEEGERSRSPNGEQ
jgi:hypothetical protein